MIDYLKKKNMDHNFAKTNHKKIIEISTYILVLSKRQYDIYKIPTKLND